MQLYGLCHCYDVLCHVIVNAGVLKYMQHFIVVAV